jgi:hypothetical protein
MSGTRAPSGFRIAEAMSALMQAKARLLAEAPDITEDEKLLLDSIEGEAEGDPFAVIDRLVSAAIHAADMAEIANVRAIELAERKARFKRRNEQLRAIVLDMIDALGIRKLERPVYTVSLKDGIEELLIDEDAVPDDFYMRITKTLDRTATRKALKDGETLSWARLGNNKPSLVIRTK